jgi:uncharacterized protein (DUF983 family)
VCGLDFTPHRADDLPAYLVIVIVGHIVVPTALLIEADYSPSAGLQLAIYLPLTVVLSLALLQPVKRRSRRAAMGVPHARLRRQCT